MLNKKLENYNIILASGSPRRQQFFKDLDIDVDIKLKPVDEVYPIHLKHAEISNYLAELKAKAFKTELQPKDILITSDTIVWHNNTAMGKPKDKTEAFNMLKSYSNTTHDVISSVCFTTASHTKTLYNVTKVTFKALTDAEINYYIDTYKPFDKAGAYGIQEWIGQIAVTQIEGSYFNVMGLPTHLIYSTLNDLI